MDGCGSWHFFTLVVVGTVQNSEDSIDPLRAIIRCGSRVNRPTRVVGRRCTPPLRGGGGGRRPPGGAPRLSRWQPHHQEQHRQVTLGAVDAVALIHHVGDAPAVKGEHRVNPHVSLSERGQE